MEVRVCIPASHSAERQALPGTRSAAEGAEEARRWLYSASRHGGERRAVRAAHRCWSCPSSRNAKAGTKRVSEIPLEPAWATAGNIGGKTHMRRGILPVLPGVVHGRPCVPTTTPLGV